MKIDLEEIAKRAAHIKKHVENENAIQDPDSRYSYKLPLLACEEIAAALEQLPKMVAALRIILETERLTSEIPENENLLIIAIEKTLEPFTTKTEQNG